MLRKWIRFAILAAGVLLTATSQAAPTEGKDYKTAPKAYAVEVPGKLEVLEFFWYGCPHCYKIEPQVSAWAQKLPKDVNFRRIHVVWANRPDIEAHAKIFVALQAMGLSDKYQQAVMDAIQRDRIELRRDDVLSVWLKKQGINEAKFRANYGSFTSNMAMKKMQEATSVYGADGVPMFFVNGKYMTSPALVGEEGSALTQVIDELLNRERLLARKK